MKNDVLRPIAEALAMVALICLWLFVAALLNGCASAPEVKASVQTVTVEKAVPVPCVAAADVPAACASPYPSAPADLARNAAAASADVRCLVDENRALRALIVQCTQGGKP